jgi:hypothetical protein
MSLNGASQSCDTLSRTPSALAVTDRKQVVGVQPARSLSRASMLMERTLVAKDPGTSKS